MAKAKRAVKKKAARKGAGGKKGKGEATLSLSQFAAQVRTRLSKLEKEIQGADATKQLTRMLRDASHQLGKWEAWGEKRWKKLTSNARADAVKLLKRIEKSLNPAPAAPKPAAPKPVAPRPAAPPMSAPRPIAPRPPMPAPYSPSMPARPPMSSPSGMPPRGDDSDD